MSHPAYIAPYVEITVFICILKVVISAVFVVTFPGYSIQFPPAVSRTRIGSSLRGRTLTTMCEYLSVHPTGILFLVIKQIVFVPFLNFPADPSAIRPNYFDSPFCQRSLVFTYFS